VTAEGRPNLSPKGTTTLWDEEHLMFADLASPGTIENLATNPHVEINVVDPILRKGYRFKGTAAVYTSGQMFDHGLEILRSGAFDRGDRRDQCRTGGVARLRRWHLGGDHRPALASALRTPPSPAARLAA